MIAIMTSQETWSSGIPQYALGANPSVYIYWREVPSDLSERYSTQYKLLEFDSYTQKDRATRYYSTQALIHARHPHFNVEVK